METTDTVVRNLLIGSLRDVINQHGPITSDLIGSVVKRATPQLVKYIEEKDGRGWQGEDS